MSKRLYVPRNMDVPHLYYQVVYVQRRYIARRSNGSGGGHGDANDRVTMDPIGRKKNRVHVSNNPPLDSGNVPDVEHPSILKCGDAVAVLSNSLSPSYHYELDDLGFSRCVRYRRLGSFGELWTNRQRFSGWSNQSPLGRALDLQ